MTPTFTKAELRKLFSILSRVTQPLAAPLTLEDLVDAGDLCRRTEALIASNRGAVERGALVFSWRISTEYAPTMNELSQWVARQRWRPGKAKQELVRQLEEIRATTPGADLCGGQRARWVRVTRFTTQPKRIDDNAVDQIGGKLPIDMLKRAGMIVDDSPRWLVREARVEKTARGNTHVFVELFETADDAADVTARAADGAAPAPPVYGPMTQAIVGEGTGPRTKERRSLPFGDAEGFDDGPVG